MKIHHHDHNKQTTKLANLKIGSGQKIFTNLKEGASKKSPLRKRQLVDENQAKDLEHLRRALFFPNCEGIITLILASVTTTRSNYLIKF